MKVLVTGGAGYVGSHALGALRRNGHEPVVLDDLSEGHEEAIGDCPLIRADLSDEEEVAGALGETGAEAVMHFAASAYVGEDQPMQGISPYGRTKVAVEQVLADYAAAYGLRYASLRYFNAAGAALDGEIGEDHDPETHLIPLVIFAALGKHDSITIFGTDYPTPDGTCVRDYVHVLDLASAHVMAMEALEERQVMVYNLSTGQGHSVREVIEVVKKVSGRDFQVVEAPRRPGDAPVLVGAPEKIARELGWEPRESAIERIVETAWAWHSTHPDGFGGR
ncbi:MAG: UDP-glucose 4-epimerase GalE [Planctomycetota bacterium]|jgi:UDP-glucose 4-epimerase